MWQLKTYDKEKEEAFIKRGTHKLLARLLAQRNIKLEEADKFLTPDYKDLSHPYKLHDVEKASKIFIDIVKAKGKVAVIGDYDADGVISSVMIRELCHIFGLECNVFLPSRLDHGYGLNPKTVAAFKEKLTVIPDLLIVVDCGMNNFKEIQELRNSGIKYIVIIDHHIGNKDQISTNADALVTWHLSEGICEMCACGEVFQFIRGIRWLTKRVDPIEFLSYAAIGTIADVSPVIGDNRIIVKNGLTEYALNNVVASGLAALLKQSKIQTSALSQEDISFQIAPKINAVGRMHHPDIIFGLLVERDMSAAENIAGYILSYNDERKDVQKQIEIEAKAMIEMGNGDFANGILIINDSWHIGVVGIVAARLVDTYKKPVIVVGKHNGIWKGSGRTIVGVSIKEILDECPEIFDSYGGHDAAVGVTIKPKYLKKANAIFNKACKSIYAKHKIDENAVQYYDGNLTVKAIDPKIAKVLKQNLSPYCDENNNEPIFMLSEAIITDVSIMDKGKGWRLMKFNVEKDGYKIPYPFKTFSNIGGTELEGKKANIMFSFPQKLPNPNIPYSQFELTAVDVITL